MTAVERRIVQVLRERSEKAIEQHGREWAAERLGIAVTGVGALLWEWDWSVGKATHIASQLGVLTDADVDRLASV